MKILVISAVPGQLVRLSLKMRFGLGELVVGGVASDRVHFGPYPCLDWLLAW